MHIGVFGGTFNPIHYGHLRTAKRVTRTYSLDLCLLMVANSPPDKNMQYGILPSQRYEMAARALNELPSYSNIQVSDLELLRGGTSYTYDTVVELKAKYNNPRISLIIGADRLFDIHTWHRAEELLKQVSLIVIRRKGFGTTPELFARAEWLRQEYGTSVSIPDFTGPAISSTQIREYVYNAKPISELLPYNAERYIYEHALYQPDYIKVIEEDLRSRLSHKRFVHSVSTMRCAIALADKYGADADKCRLAALLHDCEKVSGADYLALAKQYGLEPDEYELEHRGLLHAKIGAYMARVRYGITDEEVLRAIQSHTLCRKGMSVVEKIVYIADKIEADRDFLGVEGLRMAAKRSLKEGMVACLDFTINSIKHSNKSLHPNTIEARDYIINNE